MVPVTPTSLLSGRLAELQEIIRESFADADAASRGFALRLLRYNHAWAADLQLHEGEGELTYGGIPAVALFGFLLGAQGRDRAGVPYSFEAFLAAITRLRGRPSGARDQLADDDLAVLGLADGLAAVASQGSSAVPEAISWLAAIADQSGSGPLWSRRMRSLAADILDRRGRLRVDIPDKDWDAIALDLCLRCVWPTAFATLGYPSRELQQELMSHLITSPCPVVGDLGRAIVWLVALDVLTRDIATVLLPAVSDVVRILKATQAGLRRWVWEDQPRRAQVAPARWLIDSEAHVQAYLWSVLYPIFGAALLDEQYLPGYGLKQARYDFGILSLKLIIEVKIVRTPAAFSQIEEEIAGDVGLYFSEPARFERLIAFVYDDCDAHHPERYDALRNALLQRDTRIVEVVIVRRPGMIPNRAERGAQGRIA